MTVNNPTWFGLTQMEWAGCLAAAVFLAWALDITTKINIAYRRTGGDPK